MIDNELDRLAAKREQLMVEQMAVTELLRVKSIEARKQGWSAQRIANHIGVSKRTIQVWTDNVA